MAGHGQAKLLPSNLAEELGLPKLNPADLWMRCGRMADLGVQLEWVSGLLLGWGATRVGVVCVCSNFLCGVIL